MKGVCLDFGGVFVTSEELKERLECNYKEVMLAAEVHVASNFPKSAKLMSVGNEKI